MKQNLKYRIKTSTGLRLDTYSNLEEKEFINWLSDQQFVLGTNDIGDKYFASTTTIVYVEPLY